MQRRPAERAALYDSAAGVARIDVPAFAGVEIFVRAAIMHRSSDMRRTNVTSAVLLR